VRARFGLSAQDIVVGKIARLFKLKGHDDLLDVAPGLVRACPRLKFLLVGDGQWRARLAQRARALGVERHFVFAGLVPPETIPALLGIMDIVVHLSRREGLARALPQALAAARPIVACDCDGAQEVCLDNETGFLLAPGDMAGLSERILRLAQDAALRRRLGERGRQLVQERFALQRMVDDLYALYLRLAARRPGPT
jgi:glycosyltransferase involved in cell wall biosynthesis